MPTRVACAVALRPAELTAWKPTSGTNSHYDFYEVHCSNVYILVQVYWTREVIDAITHDGCKGLATYGDQCTAELNKIVALVRGQLTSLERATCGALVVIDVHAR